VPHVADCYAPPDAEVTLMSMPSAKEADAISAMRKRHKEARQVRGARAARRQQQRGMFAPAARRRAVRHSMMARRWRKDKIVRQ